MNITWSKLPSVPGRARIGTEIGGCQLFVAQRPKMAGISGGGTGGKPYTWMVVRRADGRGATGNTKTLQAAKAAAVARSRAFCRSQDTNEDEPFETPAVHHARRKTPDAQLQREIDTALEPRLAPAIQSCVRLGLDTTASQLAYCVRNAVGPSVSEDAVNRAAAHAWRLRHPRHKSRKPR